MKLTARIKAQSATAIPAPVTSPDTPTATHWHKSLLERLDPKYITRLETHIDWEGVLEVRVDYRLPNALFKVGSPPPV